VLKSKKKDHNKIRLTKAKQNSKFKKRYFEKRNSYRTICLLKIVPLYDKKACIRIVSPVSKTMDLRVKVNQHQRPREGGDKRSFFLPTVELTRKKS
jgi:hypothetical protein